MEVGKCIYAESVTKYWLGRVVAIPGPFSVTLEDACWVPDTGRFHLFLQGKPDGNAEFEPVPDGQRVTVQWVDYIDWPHPLPRAVK